MASRVLLAAEQGNREAMTTYITNKQVNVVDEEGSTPLMVAAANGRDEIIRLLLEQEVSVFVVHMCTAVVINSTLNHTHHSVKCEPWKPQSSRVVCVCVCIGLCVCVCVC